jgi:hypothetical protein
MGHSPPNRSRLWIGLGLVAAAPLLGEETLLRWAGGGLRASAATALCGALVQALVFAGGIAALRGRRTAFHGPAPRATTWGFGAAWLGANAAVLGFEATTGAGEWLCAGAALALALLALRSAAALLLSALGARRAVPGVGGPLLAIASVTLAAALAEALLGAAAHRPPAAGANGASGAGLVMPEALARREASVPGAREAYWWQGKLHVLDADRLRRTTPLPPKTPGVFRIAALGDSLTYGAGVAAEEAWPAVLEGLLRPEFRVEVLNLGVSGSQSEDVFLLARRLLPALDPDLVLYGVCLNDFLPSGRGEYKNNRAWSFTLPYGFHLEHGTRLGALAVDAYDRLLMRAGVRADFYTDILRDFGHYQQRFARDASALNALATARGLPPVVALVLNQFPAVEGPGWRIGQLAERLLRDAGLAVVPADYIPANAGRSFAVSRWEGHPNAEGQRLFAEAFAAAVRRDPRLAAYRAAGAAPAAAPH